MNECSNEMTTASLTYIVLMIFSSSKLVILHLLNALYCCIYELFLVNCKLIHFRASHFDSPKETEELK